MIRRIRTLINSLPARFTRDPGAESEIGSDNDASGFSDSSLEVLCKNAVRSNWSEPDAARVWQVLSGRVTGPFGGLAVEGPAGTEIYPTSVEQPGPFALVDHSDCAPGTLNEAAGDRGNREMFKMPDGGLMLR